MKPVIPNLLLLMGLLAGLWPAGCKKDGALEKKITPRDFLSDNTYDKLVIEVQYVSGYEPSAAALDNLKTLLQNRLHKSSINIIQSSIKSPGESSFSVQEIEKTEKKNRTQYSKNGTLTAYIVFLDAGYENSSGNSKVLGIAYGNTSMAIFEKVIREFSGGIGQPSVGALETTVINHEFGHTLGLVNNGTPMHTNHQDNPHGKHCNEKNCLMHYSAETSDIIANLLGGIPGLDNQCMEDLKNNGGK